MSRPDVISEAERVLDAAPGYVWDGERLPVPVEDIADSVFGLLVRDVKDMATAPGAPVLREGQALSGLLLPGRGEIWVNADCQGPSGIPTGGQLVPHGCWDLWDRRRVGCDRPPAKRSP